MATALAGWVALTETAFGRYVTAIGANTEAARLGSGSSNAAVGFEVEAIAAVVLGGTALLGGRGTIVGTV